MLLAQHDHTHGRHDHPNVQAASRTVWTTCCNSSGLSRWVGQKRLVTDVMGDWSVMDPGPALARPASVATGVC